MTAPRAPLALLLCLTSAPAAAQQPPDTSSSAGRLEVSPARLELAVGDSLQLSAKAFDTTGKADPRRHIFFNKQGLAAAQVDSTGMVRTGGIGDLRVLVTALVPGSRPILRIIEVNVLPSAGQADRDRLARRPDGQGPAGPARSDGLLGRGRRAATTRSAGPARRPRSPRVSGSGVVEARGPGKATLTAAAGGIKATTVVEVASATPASLAIEPADVEGRAPAT